jgi:multiple sugar transport system permease protein
MGYASAMAWLLFIFVVILTIIIFRTSASRVYYGGQ